MANTEDRRRAPRVQLKPAAGAELSRFPVNVADVSVTGARLQHDNPLTLTPGKRFVLNLVCNGERFTLTCTVARSRLEINPSTRRMTYTTGVRFVDIDEFTIARLWSAISTAFADSLRREAPTGPLGFEIRH